ncbi:hypothetical protein [Ruminococcus sp. HUN007]|uniref:type II secretion system F family protein n=1 Tax=Ruminococcus sp. HUN007 TaxID=1514668 RepID=UPI0005D20277|nr:hypothetical protein [Ruminococcus sp. HUN007]
MKSRKYKENRGLTGRGTDYSVYRMTPVQAAASAAAGGAGGALAFSIFFGAGIPAAAAAAAGAAAGVKYGTKFFKERRNSELTMQFKDLLESIASSLSAGQNIPCSIESALTDLKQIYGDKSLIVKETSAIADGMRNNLNPEELFGDFALRSGQKDIRTFAETFSVCNRSGGNMRDVIIRTTRILSEKMQTEKEISVIASKGRNQLWLMTVMPFIIIPMLKTLGEDGVSGNNIITVVVKAVGAVIIAGAVFAGKRITDIRM